MHSEILLKVDLVHAAEGAKKIAESRPQPFVGVDVNLTDSVSIVIACPDTLARRMANGDMLALRLGQMLVGAPFVGIDSGALSRRLQDAGLKIPSCAVFFKRNWIWPLSRPTIPKTGGRSVSHVPWPRA